MKRTALGQRIPDHLTPRSLRVIRVAAVLVPLTLLMPLEVRGDTQIALGGGFGVPEKVFGAVDVVQPFSRGKVAMHLHATGGQAGAKVGVGIVLPVLVCDAYACFGLLSGRVTLGRTWGSPLGWSAGQTLVGGEVEYAPLMVLGLSAGVQTPVAPYREGSTRLVWGLRAIIPLSFFK